MKKSTTLSEIQRQISLAIKSQSYHSDLEQIVCLKPPVSTANRIKIYQDAYQIRMLEALRDDFSRVEENVGKEEFKALSSTYLEKNPSKNANLAEFSQNFPDFIKKHSIDLYELAAIDWIEILSAYKREIESEKILSAEQVESGIPFQLVRNPTLESFVGRSVIAVSYRKAGQVQVQMISPEEFEILNILNSSMELSEFSKELEKLSISSELVSQIVSKFIKNDVIQCERISR